MNKLKIDPDSKFLVYSYLPLEDLLALLEHNEKLRDKLIKRYHPELFHANIDEEIKKDHYYAAKYLISKSKDKIIFTTSNMLNGITRGNLTMIRLSHENGIQIHKDHMHIAVKCKHLKIIRYLVSIGIPYTLSNLYTLMIYKHTDIFKYLIEYGTFSSQEIGLYYLNHGFKILKYYDDHHVKISTLSEIINIAAQFGNLEIIKYLISQKISPTSKTLEIAAANGNLDIVIFLLENNIEPSKNAVIWASRYGHLAIVKYLYEYTLKSILDSNIEVTLEMVEYLMQHNNIFTSEVIDAAIEQNHFEIVKYLFERGIKPTQIGIEYAIRYKYHNIVRYFNQYGMKQNKISGKYYFPDKSCIIM